MLTKSPNPVQPLPWWTWVLPLIILHLASQLSAWSSVMTGTSLFYFTTPFGLIMCYWWGLRVVPAVFINSIISAVLFGLSEPLLYPIYAIPETLYIFLSWLFFIKWGKGKSWLPNIFYTSLYLIIGITVPFAVFKLIQVFLIYNTGLLTADQFLPILISVSLSDFILIFAISFPALYFFTGPLTKRKLTLIDEIVPDRTTPLLKKIKSMWFRVEFVILVALVLVLSRTLQFSDFWFTYGILSLYAAIRFGFGIVILFNTYILILTYFIPTATGEYFNEKMFVGDELNKIQLGMGLLYVFSAITGRVMSDAGGLKKRLLQKNDELEQANKELDRFVYSVSHDLSAPLKSIMGLVNVSRLEKEDANLRPYFTSIETSVFKLENFIGEILDYSRNERQEVSMEQVSLHELCHEILDNLKFQEGFNKLNVNLTEINDLTLYTDKMRLKMILNNLLSNAVKFQKVLSEDSPFICVRARESKDQYFIEVEDNGEGITPEAKGRIFEMFFRGTQRAKGSGLGLYIAKEAAEKINGRLTVSSEYGKGSVFYLEIKKHE